MGAAVPAAAFTTLSRKFCGTLTPDPAAFAQLLSRFALASHTQIFINVSKKGKACAEISIFAGRDTG
jgi:hypothetical protein